MDSQESQAQIMRSVFAIQEKCLFLQQEMNDCSGYALMNQVLESTNAKYNIRVIEVSKEDFQSITVAQWVEALHMNWTV